jgi:tetratricopeptide (TPR) repeat protein
MCIGSVAPTAEEIREQILSNDTFGFINYAGDDEVEMTNSVEFKEFSFKQMFVQRCIAGLWTRKIAKELHQTLTNMLIDEVNDENMHLLLPHIRYQAKMAEDDENYFKYTEAFGFYCSNVLLINEAIECFEAVKQIFKDKYSDSEVSNQEFGPIRQADWDRHLAKMYHARRDYDATVRHLSVALELLGKPVPIASSGKLMMMLFKQGLDTSFVICTCSKI